MDQTPPILQRLFSLEGKVAVITGATGGLGSALSLGLAEAGAMIGVHGRDSAKVDELCREIERCGGKAFPLIADLQDVEAGRAMIAHTKEEAGRLDILINNAATNRRKRIQEVSVEDFDLITAVNVRSIYFLSQAASALMREEGGGKIIHIGSITIFMALDTVSVYGLSKGAVGQMTKTMAVEWAKDNIQVNCVTPGFISTPLSEPIWSDDYKANWLRGRIPMRRPSRPDEFLGVMVMLSSHASDYITGQNIVVDGGVLAGGSWEQDES